MISSKLMTTNLLPWANSKMKLNTNKFTNLTVEDPLTLAIWGFQMERVLQILLPTWILLISICIRAESVLTLERTMHLNLLMQVWGVSVAKALLTSLQMNSRANFSKISTLTEATFSILHKFLLIRTRALKFNLLKFHNQTLTPIIRTFCVSIANLGCSNQKQLQMLLLTLT